MEGFFIGREAILLSGDISLRTVTRKTKSFTLRADDRRHPGHIDQDKTALVKALTRIDADRLKEKRRPSGEPHPPVSSTFRAFLSPTCWPASGESIWLLMDSADESITSQTRFLSPCISRILALPSPQIVFRDAHKV